MKAYKPLLALLLFVFYIPSTLAQVRDGTYQATQKDNPTDIIDITVTSLGNGITLYTQYIPQKRENKPLNGSYHFEIHGNRRHIEGNFVKGLPEGEWTEYMYSDIFKKYNFKNGKLNGKTYTFHDDGSHRSIGTYKDGNLQHYISYFPNGQIEEEKIYDEQGKKHGKAIAYNKEGQIVEEAYYEHGFYHGKKTEINDNGYKVVETYNQGSLEGEYQRFYPNGNKQEEGEYDTDHKKNGKWTTWYENENIKMVVHYLNGKLHGEKRTNYEEGHPQTVEEYADNKLNGKRIDYDETPNVIISEYTYTNGVLNGESKSYHNGEIWRESFYKNGTLLREKEYKNGKLNVLRLLDDTGKMIDVQQYNAAGKITNRNTTYKKPESIKLKEDASGIIDIEF